jgi:putative transposase
MVEPAYKGLSVRRQCELLGLSRSGYYYQPRPVDEETLKIMDLIDRQFLETPILGKRRMKEYLETQGHSVGIRRVARLMRLMGLKAIYPRPKTSKAHPEHKIYPYLLRDLEIDRPNQVWSADITYIPMPKGFMYLAAIMDLYSRKVLTWSLSNTMDTNFCVAALEKALYLYGAPEIFNTDQGSQFTSEKFTSVLKEHGVKISMDGKGRFKDNIFIERLWRSVKYECVYIKEFKEVTELRESLKRWFLWYNGARLHQALGYRTPDKVYWEGLEGLPCAA